MTALTPDTAPVFSIYEWREGRGIILIFTGTVFSDDAPVYGTGVMRTHAGDMAVGDTLRLGEYRLGVRERDDAPRTFRA